MRTSFSNPKLVRRCSSDPLLDPISFIELISLITIVGLILRRICAIPSTVLSSVTPKLDALSGGNPTLKLCEALKSGLAPNVSDAHTLNGHPGQVSSCPSQGGFTLPVENGKTYLLRLINAALNEDLFFKIAGHKLTVVQIDATYVKPFKTDSVLIAPGQTTNVLVSADQNSGKYLVTASPFMIRGLGNYNSKTDPQNFNLVNPVESNTIGVPTGGLVAIRFRADNPGVWFMHCHLEVYTTWGLKMAFLVDNGKGPNQSLLPPPSDLPKC
ncbi:hypothetical protein CRYUN_Cryun09bG0010200 [Craigia yunnanensis]